ncbi:MAG TPA: hypothetical protein VL068_08920 [Microthrixaceae bacterium]|nr:hypothetical protein [Microthrixaceae bacterium]
MTGKDGANPMRGHTSVTSLLGHKQFVRTSFCVLAAAVILVLAGCTSSNDDEPAVVTLPENNTSVPPSTMAPGSSGEPAGPAEPPEVAWVTQIGGAGDDAFNAVTGDGVNVVATGTTSQGVDTPTAGGADILTARVSAEEGKLDKLSQFGSAADDKAMAIAGIGWGGPANELAPGPPADSGPEGEDSPQGNSRTLPVACGTTLGNLGATSAGAGDAWCGPATPSDIAGVTSGAAPGTVQMGGSENDLISGIAKPGPIARSSGIDPDFFYLSGSTSGFYPGAEDPAGQGLGAGDALAFRASMTGGTSWVRQFGTPKADAALGVCAVGGDGYYAGWTDGDLSGQSKGGRDAWISLIDASGVQRWITQFGSGGEDQFNAVTNAGDPSRGTMQLIAVGSSTGDVDAEGTGINSGSSDAMVASFAPDGTLLWTNQFGGALDDKATGVAVDGATIYVTGTTTGDSITPGADPGQVGEIAPDGSTTTTTTKAPVTGVGDLDPKLGKGGSKDIFMAAIDAASGQTLWIVRLGSEKDEEATAITATPTGLLVISGTTTGQLGETPPAGGTDGFLLAFPLPAAGGAAASSV